MPKITAEVPENLYRFLRSHIVDQRISGVHITVSTIVTNLLSVWERENFNLHDTESSKAEEEKDQTTTKSPSNMNYAENDFSFESIGEELKQLILSARLSTEEAKLVAASLIRITQELLELTATIRK